MSYSEAVVHFVLSGCDEDAKVATFEARWVYRRCLHKSNVQRPVKKATIQRPALRGIIVASQAKIAFSYAKEDAGIGPIYTIQI
jgi:hypothetical protein